MLNKQNGFQANVCDILVSFSGELTPSKIDGWQRFYNSIGVDIDFFKLYFRKASVSFNEKSSNGSSGVFYNQKLTLSFPEKLNDFRADRIAELHKIKFVALNMSNGKSLIIGRNDFKQNTSPKIEVQTNNKITQLSVECQSIFPTGYTPDANAFGLPTFFPVSFL